MFCDSTVYNNHLKGKCVLVSSGNYTHVQILTCTKTHLPFRKFSTSSEVPAQNHNVIITCDH